MIGMTLCSGIGAPELAAAWVDWQLASEIEDFPRAVLQARFAYKTPVDHRQGEPLLWGDMTEVSPELLRRRGVPLPDLLVAGTPCQAFSVAGLRKGTADPRGNLTLKFVEIVHELTAARPDGKLAVVWENVPGVLSDKGNAFGSFLGGLIGSDDALPAPVGGRWPKFGMASGPKGRCAWRVLDAQWFGVAQRRRRVFVVVDFGNCIDPAAILFELQSMCGDSPPRRETGKVAPTIPARGSGGGGLGTDFDTDGGLVVNSGPAEVAPAPPARSSGGGGKGIAEGKMIASTGEVAHCLNAGGMGRQDYETETIVAHTLRGEGFDASEDGTGRGTPIIPIAFDCKGTEVQFRDDDGAITLRSMGHNNSHQNAGGHAAVAFDLRGREGGAMPEGPHNTVSIRSASGGSSRSYIAQPWAVRRITPLECERLQGTPDNHTQIEWRGKPASDCPDGHRYKGIGNSMAVPVMKWILDRVRISFEIEATSSNKNADTA
ncbi:MAG: DNA cytosine methyltransferase [Thalassovita sp.]